MEATPSRAKMLDVIASYGNRHFTHLDIAKKTGVSTMTVSRFTLILERLGVLERIKAKPAHLFVWVAEGRTTEANQFLNTVLTISCYMEDQQCQ